MNGMGGRLSTNMSRDKIINALIENNNFGETKLSYDISFLSLWQNNKKELIIIYVISIIGWLKYYAEITI